MSDKKTEISNIHDLEVTERLLGKMRDKLTYSLNIVGDINFEYMSNEEKAKAMVIELREELKGVRGILTWVTIELFSSVRKTKKESEETEQVNNKLNKIEKKLGLDPSLWKQAETNELTKESEETDD